jgi:hypothetical protein
LLLGGYSITRLPMAQIKENVFDIMYEPLAESSLTNLFRLTSQNYFRIVRGIFLALPMQC